MKSYISSVAGIAGHVIFLRDGNVYGNLRDNHGRDDFSVCVACFQHQQNAGLFIHIHGEGLCADLFGVTFSHKASDGVAFAPAVCDDPGDIPKAFIGQIGECGNLREQAFARRIRVCGIAAVAIMRLVVFIDIIALAVAPFFR